MRIFTILLFWAVFAGLPFYLLNNLVMPQLDALAENYKNFDATAQQVAGSK